MENKAVFFDGLTNETVERALSEDELAEIELSNQTAQAELEAKEAARTSALAKLAALGLTEEEIAAL